MRHFQKLCIALFAFFAYNANAQIQDLDLSDYKLPELKRQTLGFDFALSNRVDKSFYSTNYFEDFEEEIMNSAALNSRVIHTFYHNSPYWQQDFYSSVNMAAGYRDAKEDKALINETHRFNGGLSLYLVNRYYLQGMAAMVYHTGLGPISLSFNYYEKPNTKFYLSLNFGYTIFNKRGI